MEVPWMQPFFSFPKVWFALPMAGAQEAGHRRLQRIALFRGLGDNASASGLRAGTRACVSRALRNLWLCSLMTGTCRCVETSSGSAGMCVSVCHKCEVRNVIDIRLRRRV
jgi:hypothetical protein